MKYLRYNSKNDTVRIELNLIEVNLLKGLIQDELRKKVESCDNSYTFPLFDMLYLLDNCKDALDLPF